jgi:antitoxin (DNA-binding transcriptional repressor) of toxin-antitoxin stability system
MSIANFHASDNLIFMREMTANEVARSFSEVLAAVEAGEEIVILRGKKEVARLVPTKPHVPNGAALADWYAKRAANGELLGQYPEWVAAMDEVMADRERQRKEMKTKWDDVY